MVVLISGATGVVGRPLIRVLIDGGHQVVGLVRKPAQITGVSRQIIWDGNRDLDAGALANVQVVIHLAGESVAGGRWTKSRKQKIWNSRIATTLKLVSAVNQYGVQVHTFLCASATGYYDDQHDDWLREESGPGQGFLADLCQAWEGATAALRPGVRVVNLRTGIVLAKQGGFFKQVAPVFRRGLGGKLGNGKQWVSWIHLNDWVRLVVLILKSPGVSGAFNLVAPEPIRNGELTMVLAKIFHRPAKFSVPKSVLKLVFGEMALLLLASQRVSAQRALDLGFQFEFPDFSSAVRDLAGQPTAH